jgi:AraC family transcriptional activator of pobA
LEIERRYEIKPVVGISKYQDNQFARFELLVEKHFKEHKTVSQYADMMNLSVKQLNSLCKKVMDRTPGDILLERIVLEAKRLLIHSDYPVFTISETLNYYDNSYFIRLFKKATNMTPEQFRSRVALHNVA